MSKTLEELQEIAKRATQESWFFDEGETVGYYYHDGFDGEIKAVASEVTERDGKHVEAFNPQRVLEMLALLREAELYVIEHAGCYPQPNRMDTWLERLARFEKGETK